MSAWSGCTSLSRNYLALTGGKQGSPAKQYLATLASKVAMPVDSNLQETYRSYVIHLRNLEYSGLVFSSLPRERVSLSHHVIVDTPNKSESIPFLTFCMKVVTNLGCSVMWRKKR